MGGGKRGGGKWRDRKESKITKESVENKKKRKPKKKRKRSKITLNEASKTYS